MQLRHLISAGCARPRCRFSATASESAWRQPQSLLWQRIELFSELFEACFGIAGLEVAASFLTLLYRESRASPGSRARALNSSTANNSPHGEREVRLVGAILEARIES